MCAFCSPADSLKRLDRTVAPGQNVGFLAVLGVGVAIAEAMDWLAISLLDSLTTFSSAAGSLHLPAVACSGHQS